MSTKWERRDKKRRKARHGMRVRGRSVQLLAELPGTTKSKKRKRGKKK